MSYDLELAPDHIQPKVSIDPSTRTAPVRGADLEAIVMLLELAAISLTNGPNDKFTAGELFAQACDIAGDGTDLDETDVKLVLDKASFLKRENKHYRLR